MIKPSNGWVSNGFSSSHMAVDIVSGFRSDVVAPVSGKVTATGQMGSGTNDAGLVVQIGTTVDGHRLTHLDEILVSVGQNVSQGQVVGRMGFTGYTQPDNVVAGTHVHWVMWKDGVRVDGLNYLTNNGGNTGGQMFQNDDEVVEAYLMLRGVRPSSAEVLGWLGQPKQRFFQAAKAEADGYRLLLL